MTSPLLARWLDDADQIQNFMGTTRYPFLGEEPRTQRVLGWVLGTPVRQPPFI